LISRQRRYHSMDMSTRIVTHHGRPSYQKMLRPSRRARVSLALFVVAFEFHYCSSFWPMLDVKAG
jgi:hypothetical protein